jgi:hypothetical protein
MQTRAFANTDFAIPPSPAQRRPSGVSFGTDVARRRARAAGEWIAGLGPVQEASLVGIVTLLACWGLAELALLLQGL